MADSRVSFAVNLELTEKKLVQGGLAGTEAFYSSNEPKKQNLFCLSLYCFCILLLLLSKLVLLLYSVAVVV